MYAVSASGTCGLPLSGLGKVYSWGGNATGALGEFSLVHGSATARVGHEEAWLSRVVGVVDDYGYTWTDKSTDKKNDIQTELAPRTEGGRAVNSVLAGKRLVDTVDVERQIAGPTLYDTGLTFHLDGVNLGGQREGALPAQRLCRRHAFPDNKDGSFTNYDGDGNPAQVATRASARCGTAITTPAWGSKWAIACPDGC